VRVRAALIPLFSVCWSWDEGYARTRGQRGAEETLASVIRTSSRPPRSPFSPSLGLGGTFFAPFRPALIRRKVANLRAPLLLIPQFSLAETAIFRHIKRPSSNAASSSPPSPAPTWGTHINEMRFPSGVRAGELAGVSPFSRCAKKWRKVWSLAGRVEEREREDFFVFARKRGRFGASSILCSAWRLYAWEAAEEGKRGH